MLELVLKLKSLNKKLKFEVNQAKDVIRERNEKDPFGRGAREFKSELRSFGEDKWPV